ncbi:hypothetical protein [Sphingopyxis sp.]|uniref:hypothetical protein n=1 Tax=Sphingopyxis sp. TaxID=1908224 RepID=UPI002B471BA2|nr:hypothetical protein [Sphingopyxis sp.]HJS12135.1 hypothetical protein [Sphingopyxis sp.]
MIAEAGAAISSIKAAMDIARGVSSLKSEADINQAIIDIQRALLEAQNAALEDKQRLFQLRSELEELQRENQLRGAWELEKKRYVLTRSEKGAFTYDLKPDEASSEIFHRLCATCFGRGEKSILHTIRSGRGGETVHCAVCDKEFKLKEFAPVQVDIPSTRYNY